MRLAKASLTVIAMLALLVWVAAPLPAQTKSPTKAPPETKQPSKTPPASSQAAQAPRHPKQPTKAKAAPGVKQPGQTPPTAKSSQPAKVRPASAVQPPTPIARRDPFDPLVGKQHSAGGLPERLPPGKAGLVVSTLRLDGIVRGPNGMIAVVSNPQQRVYFLREGDQLYDGRVEHITMDAVAFHESGKDAFGKPVDREVTKRLYTSPGEQQ